MLHRVLVCGGRDYSDMARLFAVMDHYHREAGSFECLISGMAKGADTLAAAWAIARAVPVLPFPADWNKYGRRAGSIRNRQMLDEGKPSLAIAFPGGPGTGNMMRQARDAHVPVLAVQ